jgi:Tfp pilus assembly major pilin PilA
MNMDIKISARILTLIQNGFTLPEAFDAVLGAGSHAKLAGEIYDNLRAKART